MAWRFKASKYKNAAPIVPKPEACVRDICVGSYQTYGNNITASAAFMAFNWDHAGSSLAVLPIDDCGRKSKTMPLLHAHSDTVTDMDFSPFHDGILATGSQDCLVKIWHIPETGLTESLSNSECTFSHKQRRVETVGFHPTADFLLHSSSYTTLTLWDLISQQEVFSNADHSEVIQSVSWKRDGTLLATTCKDKIVRILDPRIDTPCIKQANSHQSIKDSRVVWLGDQTKILTTGFDSARLRQVIIRDLRNFSETEKTLELDCSTGILIPLYDPDTGMLFLAGKGDTTIAYMEVTDKEPYLIEGIRHSGEQTKGACLVPKRALTVMQGEVNRILQLTSSSVIPIMYQVPRKTYRDFHADLYPDTPGCVTELYSAQWLQGKNTQVPKISLDPANRTAGEDPIKVHRGPLSELIKTVQQITPQVTAKKPVSTYIPKITSSIPKTEFIISHNDSKQNKFDDIETEKQKDNLEKSNNEIDNKTACNNEIEIEDKFNVQNGSGDSHVLPPKPLPRASRTGSICELQTPEEVNNSTVITTAAVITTTTTTTSTPIPIPKPVARPRTTNYTPVVTSVNPNAPISGGYKPRLGPKPFTAPKLNESENNFSKVFAVPAPPANDTNTNGHEQTTPIAEHEAPTFPDTQENESTPTSDFDGTPVKGDDYKNGGKSDSSLEEDVNSNDSGYKPKTPSTAERRKLFEVRSNSKEKENEVEVDNTDTTDDKMGSFERSSVQRNSIAERRKIYENRSQSVQDATNAPAVTADKAPENKSPVMLRRKDSLKNRNKSVEDVIKEEPMETRRKPLPQRQQSHDPQANRNKPVEAPILAAPTPKRTSTVFGRVSKFRHLKGTPAHKSAHIENVRNISRQISGECDGFHANPERVAVPLSGAGGKVAVFEISRTGKLPDGVIPALVHGSNVMDFQWDPFDQQRLAVACDDGIIRLWSIPPGGLAEPTNTPTSELTAHSDKIYFIKFHHLAKDVLASGSYDMTIKIWDLSTLTERYVLNGHTEQMFSFAWSPCGVFCSTVSKDGKIRVYKPRSSDQPIREGKGPVGTRGARIVWALDGHYIVVTGFDKVSERQIMVFKSDSLQTPLNTVGLDVSPAILIPFYDEDSSTLFLTGRGDSTIYAFEIAEEAPFICPLSHHRCNSLHQGLSFLPKNVCDVASVEFAKAFRLTNNTIEPLSFTVPRIKSDLFQDDLFPPTKVTWKPTLTSAEWFNGKDKAATRISLKPDGMESLSGSQSQGAPTPTGTTGGKIGVGSFEAAQKPFNRLAWNAEISGQVKSKQEEIQKSVSERMEINMKLEQDQMEGVDEKEWDE